MSLFRKRTINRRWLWVSLFILIATVSMVGPSQAISGLLSTSLNALFPVTGSPDEAADAQGVTIDIKVPQASEDHAHADGEHASVIASSSAAPSDDAPDYETLNALPPLESAEEDSTSADNDSGPDMAAGGLSGISPFGGSAYGSPSSGQGNSGGNGGRPQAGAAGGSGGSGTAAGAEGGAITPEELADSDLMAELLPNPSTESWLFEYGFQTPPDHNEQSGHGPKGGSNGGSNGGGSNGGANGGGPGGGAHGDPNDGSDSDPQEPSGGDGESLLPLPTPWGPEDDSLVPLDEDVFVVGALSDLDPLSEFPDDPSDLPTGGEEWPKDVVNSAAPYDEPGGHDARIDAIPEPASLLLFATGAAGLIYRRRKSGEIGHGDSR